VIIGVDLRPALLTTTGVARVARESYLALAARDDVSVKGYGASWARPRFGADLPSVVAPRLPGRVANWLAPLGFSVETLLGRLDVFQHNDFVFPPVRRAAEVIFVHDLHFLAGRGWHDPGFAERVGPKLFATARRCAAVVVPNDRVRADALRLGLGSAERLVVQPLGLDHIDPAPRPDDGERLARVMTRCGLPQRPGDEVLVVVPGTREPRKNQLALVTAFLRDGGDLPARLLLVGPRGWGVPELEALLADEQALADPRGEARVATAGEVSEADLGAILRGADVVAYPSFAEGFGLPALEAMALGRAVLTSRDTPMADVGGEAVLAVDATDPAALLAGLERLVREPELRYSLAATAPARVSSLTWASHAAGLVSVYEGAVA
jgi:glycosyltransferase involved in cell wall biosynthesis